MFLTAAEYIAQSELHNLIDGNRKMLTAEHIKSFMERVLFCIGDGANINEYRQDKPNVINRIVEAIAKEALDRNCLTHDINVQRAGTFGHRILGKYDQAVGPNKYHTMVNHYNVGISALHILMDNNVSFAPILSGYRIENIPGIDIDRRCFPGGQTPLHLVAQKND